MLLKQSMLVLFGLLCCMVGAYADNSSTIQLSRSQNHFEISLDANATTGYRWYLVQYDDKIFEPAGYKYVVNSTTPGAVGVGGKAVFTFQVKSSFLQVPQKTKIRFDYMRPFSADDQVQREYTVISSMF